MTEKHEALSFAATPSMLAFALMARIGCALTFYCGKHLDTIVRSWIESGLAKEMLPEFFDDIDDDGDGFERGLFTIDAAMTHAEAFWDSVWDDVCDVYGGSMQATLQMIMQARDIKESRGIVSVKKTMDNGNSEPGKN